MLLTLAPNSASAQLDRCSGFLFVFLISVFLASEPCLAGAWTQPAGKWQTITTFNYYTTAHYKDNAGDTRPQNRYTKCELNPYAEYGLWDNLTVGGDAFLADVHQRQLTRDNNIGLADPELFARYRLYKTDRYVVSVQPLLKAPSLFQSAALPRTGTRHWEGEMALQGGMNLDAFGRTHFLEADAGYRFRTGVPNDQWRGALTLGVNLTERWTLLPQLSVIWRTDHAPVAAFSQSGDNDYNLVKGQVSALYSWREDMGVQFGGFTHLYARNTGTGGGLTVALWKSF